MRIYFKVYFLTKEEGGRPKPYTTFFQAHMFCRTWDAPASMELPEDKDMVMPGEDSSLTFTMYKEMVSTVTMHVPFKRLNIL